MNCIFCKIANKEIPSSVVYEDDNTIAILDLSQANKGHTLVMPKKHYANILEVPADVWQSVTNTALKVAKAIDKAFNPDGINILNNCKEAAGQTVMHLHVHIIPRFNDDGIDIKLSNNDGKFNLAEISESIKKNLA